MTPEQQVHFEALIRAHDNATILGGLLNLHGQAGGQPEDIAGLVALAQATIRDASAHAAALVGDPG